VARQWREADTGTYTEGKAHRMQLEGVCPQASQHRHGSKLARDVRHEGQKEKPGVMREMGHQGRKQQVSLHCFPCSWNCLF